MYNIKYEKTLESWKKISKTLEKEDYNILTSKFKIFYGDSYNKNNTWSNFYLILNKKYTVVSPFCTVLSFSSSLKLLKEIGFKNLIVDIKDFNKTSLYPHFVNIENIDKIITSEKKYTSTNNSRMSIINLDLSKVKLEDLK